MNKLIKMLQQARAAELGAFLAYDGHRKSLTDPEERKEMRQIQRDELEHLRTVTDMLTDLGAKPSAARDAIFTVIGNTLGFLCHYTSWRLAMWGALIFERIGVVGYDTIIAEAMNEGRTDFILPLMDLLSTEDAHRRYFEERLRAVQSPKN